MKNTSLKFKTEGGYTIIFEMGAKCGKEIIGGLAVNFEKSNGSWSGYSVILREDSKKLADLILDGLKKSKGKDTLKREGAG